MKGSQEIYANTDVTAWNKSQAEEDIYENELNLATWKKKQNQEPKNPGPNTAWSRCYRVTAVCLLLLCVLLLAAVTVLWLKFNNMTKDINQLQTSYNNLTLERDQIQQERSVLNRALVKLGWRRFSSSIYSISNETRSWNDTRQDCIRRGADLVIINSTEEEEFINEYFGSSDVWLGLSYIGNEEEFKRVNSGFWRFGKFQNNRGKQICYVKPFPISDTRNNFTLEPIPVPNPNPTLDPNPGPINEIIPGPKLDPNPYPTYAIPDPPTHPNSVLMAKIRFDNYCVVTAVGICRMKLYN